MRFFSCTYVAVELYVYLAGQHGTLAFCFFYVFVYFFTTFDDLTAVLKEIQGS
jgi:hypothetical protein